MRGNGGGALLPAASRGRKAFLALWWGERGKSLSCIERKTWPLLPLSRRKKVTAQIKALFGGFSFFIRSRLREKWVSIYRGAVSVLGAVQKTAKNDLERGRELSLSHLGGVAFARKWRDQSPPPKELRDKKQRVPRKRGDRKSAASQEKGSNPQQSEMGKRSSPSGHAAHLKRR